jgi:hypothetical protein
MLIPILIGLALSICIEQMHQPRPKFIWHRRPVDLSLHTGLWQILFLIEFIQFRRPWLALCLTSTIFYVLILINHTKFRLLREPFIYQDFEYFLDAIKHPRLYLPFFGFWKIALCLCAVGLALWLGTTVEKPLTQVYLAERVWTACFVILCTAAVFLYVGHRKQVSLHFKPIEDFREYGLLAMLWFYSRAEWKSFHLLDVDQPPSFAQLDSKATPALRSNTVVVQSESFFDPRRVFTNIDQNVLRGFDQACQSSIKFGTLTVPAWGANTVRTEFEFLTGIDISKLGVDQFNPYRRVVHRELPSVAREFKKRGYRTICVHPYPATFYKRDKIFPLLGFDEFIDIKAFDVTTTNNEQFHYISDHSLTDKVIELLNQETTQPLFIFVITMENHGPLHLETITEQETRKWLTESLPNGCQELPIYLRHLANADQMIIRLINQLSSTKQGISDSRPAQFLWYGDHVPMLPVEYEKLGLPDARTDYFLWRSDDRRRGVKQALSSHLLAAELLKS